MHWSGGFLPPNGSHIGYKRHFFPAINFNQKSHTTREKYPTCSNRAWFLISTVTTSRTLHYVKFQTYLWRNSREKTVWTQYLCRKCIMEKTAFIPVHVYFVDTFRRNYFAYITEIFWLQLFTSLFFPYTVILFSFHCTFCHYAAFINRLGKQVYSWSFLSPNDVNGINNVTGCAFQQQKEPCVNWLITGWLVCVFCP